MKFKYPKSVLAPDNYSYKERELRAPEVEANEKVIFDEPGRILPSVLTPRKPFTGTDCRSHYFRVTKPEFGPYTIRVRHGGGSQAWPLSHDRRAILALGKLPSDDRYRMLWIIVEAHQSGARNATSKVNTKWVQAALDKRIKVTRREGFSRVQILPPPEVLP